MLLVVGLGHPACSQDDAVNPDVQKYSEMLTTAFNTANADGVAGAFLPNGEMIDEQGTIYRGTQEIKDLASAFFQQFPGTKLAINVDSIRQAGSVVIEEGTRTMTMADGVKSVFRYIAVWAKQDDAWKLASFRDFVADPVPTTTEYLAPLAWMVGDWVNEGADGKVAISYQWSDDKNYLLGEFQVTSAEGVMRKSNQRIGWDPSRGCIRSWLFDADGGFAEAVWTLVDNGVLIKSSSVNPDGTLASATMNLEIENEGRFTLTGTDRVVDGNLDDDFSITVVRRPPAAGK
jgi:uncharacterized protein (TIGR02246 family)